jgi:hypothetical protein
MEKLQNSGNKNAHLIWQVHFFESLENEFPLPAPVARCRVCVYVTSRATAARQAPIPSCGMCDSFLFWLLITVVVLNPAVQLNSLYYVICEGRWEWIIETGMCKRGIVEYLAQYKWPSVRESNPGLNLTQCKNVAGKRRRLFICILSINIFISGILTNLSAV